MVLPESVCVQNTKHEKIKRRNIGISVRLSYDISSKNRNSQPVLVFFLHRALQSQGPSHEQGLHTDCYAQPVHQNTHVIVCYIRDSWIQTRGLLVVCRNPVLLTRLEPLGDTERTDPKRKERDLKRTKTGYGKNRPEKERKRLETEEDRIRKEQAPNGKKEV